MERKTRVTRIYSVPEFKELIGADRIDIARGKSDHYYYGSVNGSRVCGVSEDSIPLLSTPEKLGVMEITDGVEVWYLMVPRSEQPVVGSV